MINILILISIITNLVIIKCQTENLNDLIPADYDKKVLPSINDVTNVTVGINVNELLAITESDQSFQIDFTLTMKWTDTRFDLNFTNSSDIVLDNSWSSRIWKPDIYFNNALSIAVINQFQVMEYIAINRSKYVTYTVKINGKFICKMDLSNYPQDYQYCSIEIKSMTKTSDKLKLNWNKLIADRDNSKFRIRSIYTGRCDGQTPVGNFSCLLGTFKLVRRVSYYVIRVYAPTFLLVIASFIGFWIPILGWPARIAITVTPLLSLITIDIGLNNDINVYYVVAIHWWMMWCHFFVFMAIVEYAVAISWAYFINDKKKIRAEREKNMSFMDLSAIEGHYFGNNNWFAKAGEHINKILLCFFGKVDFTADPLSRNKVDYVSRMLFPSLFTLFILIYIFASVCPWAVIYNS